MSTATIPTRQRDGWQEYADACVTGQDMRAARVRELLKPGRHQGTLKDDVTLYRGRHRAPQAAAK